MEYNGKLFIERLKEVAGNKNQKQITEDLHVDNSTISRWNEKTIPKTEMLLLIAEKYNCSIDYLLGISDQKPNRAIDLFDVLLDLLICDMQGNMDCNLIFKEENGETGTQGTIIFENVYNLDSTTNTTNYGEIFEKYSRLKESFDLIDDNEMKKDIIKLLLNKYSGNFTSNVYNLPFGKNKW